MPEKKREKELQQFARKQRSSLLAANPREERSAERELVGGSKERTILRSDGAPPQLKREDR